MVELRHLLKAQQVEAGLLGRSVGQQFGNKGERGGAVRFGKDNIEQNGCRLPGCQLVDEACHDITGPRPLPVSTQALVVNVDNHHLTCHLLRTAEMEHGVGEPVVQVHEQLRLSSTKGEIEGQADHDQEAADLKG